MSNNDSNWYGQTFKSWVAARGPKPTQAQLAVMHQLGLRPGKQALACAMMLRDHGATAGQIIMACGAPQLNRMRGLVADALCKREAVPMTGDGHTVYKLVVTPKGLKRIEARVKADAAADAAGKAGDDASAAKPAKAKAVKKATSKARKGGKAPKADAPATQPPVNSPDVTDRPDVQVPQQASADLLPANPLS